MPRLGQCAVSLVRSGPLRRDFPLGENTVAETKLCECGCGQPTLIARQTRSIRGDVRGQPVHFIHGHNKRRNALDRFWSKVDKHSLNACWTWQAQLNEGGYGRFFNGHEQIPAHRFAYELLVGPIPEGLEPDHLCRNRDCVNPYHLEVVDHRTNVLRGQGIAARNAIKTHCPKGHPYDEQNTYLRPDRRGRMCYVCQDERNHRRYTNVLKLRDGID